MGGRFGAEEMEDVGGEALAFSARAKQFMMDKTSIIVLSPVETLPNYSNCNEQIHTLLKDEQ